MGSLIFHGSSDFGMMPWSSGIISGPIAVTDDGNLKNSLPDTDGSKTDGIYSGDALVIEIDDERSGYSTIKIDAGKYLQLKQRLPLAVTADAVNYQTDVIWRPSRRPNDYQLNIGAYGIVGAWNDTLDIMGYPPLVASHAGYGMGAYWHTILLNTYLTDCIGVAEDGTASYIAHGHSSIGPNQKLSLRRHSTDKVSSYWQIWDHDNSAWSTTEGVFSSAALTNSAGMRIYGYSSVNQSDYVKLQAISTSKWAGVTPPYPIQWVSPVIACPGGVTSVEIVGIDGVTPIDLADRLYYQASNDEAFTGITEWVLWDPLNIPACTYIKVSYIDTLSARTIPIVAACGLVINAAPVMGTVDIVDETKELVSITVTGPDINPGTTPETGDTLLPETWTSTQYRACMRSRLRYDGDSALLSNDLLDEMALEAQRMIVEQLRWPLTEVTLTHGSLAAVDGTVIYIKIGDTIWEPPVYPTGVDLTDITQDVTVWHLANEDYIYLPEALWQALCFLASALVLVQFENEKRELAYRRFAAERIASFSRQLKQNALANNTGTNSQYGITR